MSETTIETAEGLDAIPEFAGATPLNAGRLAGLTVRQRNTGRFLDAHENSANDYRLVTRPAQGNDSQRWQFTQVGFLVTVQQKVNGRYLDAYEGSGQDFRIVTREAQDDDSQRWVLMPAGGNHFTMQQLVNGRYADAYESGAQDFRLVTREAQDNDSQRWVLRPDRTSDVSGQSV